MRRISRIARVIPQGGSSQVEKKQLVIGAEGWEQTSPFFFLSEDWFGKPKGFETHPHRGMQTVTIVLEGGEVRVHAGRSGGVKSTRKRLSDVAPRHSAGGGRPTRKEMSTGDRGFLYVLEGGARIGGTEVRKGDVAWFAYGPFVMEYPASRRSLTIRRGGW